MHLGDVQDAKNDFGKASLGTSWKLGMNAFGNQTPWNSEAGQPCYSEHMNESPCWRIKEPVAPSAHLANPINFCRHSLFWYSLPLRFESPCSHILVVFVILTSCGQRCFGWVFNPESCGNTRVLWKCCILIRVPPPGDHHYRCVFHALPTCFWFDFVFFIFGVPKSYTITYEIKYE